MTRDMTNEQLALQERRKRIGSEWVAAVKQEEMRHEHERRKIDDTHKQEQLKLQADCVAVGGHIDDGGFMYGTCQICGLFDGA